PVPRFPYTTLFRSIRDPRQNPNLIVIAGGFHVAAGKIHHRQKNAAAFQIPVRQAQLPEKVGPAHLEPHDVVGVMHHTHLIRLFVAHAYRCFKNSFSQGTSTPGWYVESNSLYQTNFRSPMESAFFCEYIHITRAHHT